MVSNDILQYIIVSIEKNSPTKAPCDDNVSSVTVSEITHNSSRGSVQGNFHQRVLTRDCSACVFCNNNRTADLKAAHLFDIFRAEDNIPENDPDFLHQYEDITDLYDTCNGITLCSECHDVFDALLCCVEVRRSEDGAITDHIITVANALLHSPEFKEKWTALNGAMVRVPSRPRSWPPSLLFKFREDKYKERTIERHKLADNANNVCSKCGRRCKSLKGLAMHCRSKACLHLVITKSNQLS